MSGIFGLMVTDYYDVRAAKVIADLGVKWVRIDFNRQFIEPSPGVYNWSDYDTFLIAMQKIGVQVLGMITHTPPWISWSEWPAQYADIATFCQQVVNRYKPGGLVGTYPGVNWGTYGVTHWEIFNEPNDPGYGWLKI